MKHLLVMLLICAGLLTACESGINEGLNPPGIAAKIRKGITSKEQVRAILGPPLTADIQIPVVPPPGVEPLPVKFLASEIWAYRTIGYRRFVLNLPFLPSGPKLSYTVIIYFDREGRVLEYETEQRQV